MRLVAFEGTKDPRDVLSWGLGAVIVDGQLRNLATGASVSSDRLQFLIENGHLAGLPDAVQIDIECEHAPYVLVVYKARLTKKELPQPPKGVEVSDTERYRIFVFDGRDAFRAYATKAADHLVNLILASWTDQALRSRVQRMIEAGLVLDSGNPRLNALWVRFKGGSKRQIEIAELDVRAEDQGIFREFLAGLRRTEDESEFSLWYTGDRTKGGFDISVISSIESQFDNLVGFASRNVFLRHPKIFERPPKDEDAISPIKPLHRRVASVEFAFSLESEMETFANRLGRSLVLNEVESLLASKEGDPELLRAIHRVVEPLRGVSLEIKAGERSNPIGQFPQTAGMRWCKRLTAADAQHTTVGMPTGVLRLTEGPQRVDVGSYFRRELFGDQDWKRRLTRMGRMEEFCEVELNVMIQGIPLGPDIMEVCHADWRGTKARTPTWIVWGRQMRFIMSRGFYTNYWVSIEKKDGLFSVIIESAPPMWLGG